MSFRKAFLIANLVASPLWAQETVVVALGDSLTQGYGLPAEDGLVPQLSSWLAQQGAQVRLINAGVSGDTTAGGAARVGWALTDDVDAMIVALGGNDMLRGLDPAEARRNLETILQTAEAAQVDVLLVGMQAPGNFGASYQEAFNAIYPELAAQYETEFLESFFAGLTQGGPVDPAALAPFMQADGIHPNAKGVARIVEGIGPAVLALTREAP